MTLVEKLFLVLKEKPDFSMPIVEARVHFVSFERQKSFKKAMLTHVFRKIFETQVTIEIFNVQEKSYFNVNFSVLAILRCLSQFQR